MQHFPQELQAPVPWVAVHERLDYKFPFLSPFSETEMGGGEQFDRKRILVGIILVLSGGMMAWSYYQTAGPLRAVIGMPLLLIGIFALVKKPSRGGISRADSPTVLPSAVLVATEKDDPVQIMQGGEVGGAYLLLKSAGIPVFLRSSVSAIQHPNWTHPGEAGDMLMCPRSFLAQTRELLDSRVSEEDLIAQAEAAPPPESTFERGPER